MTKDEFERIVSGLSDIMKLNIEEDDQFSAESQKQIIERDKQYSELLAHFVEVTKRRNDSKERYKWIYFKIIMGLLILLNVSIFTTITVILIKCSNQQIIEAIPILITSIAGFASSIIAIPLSITKYLFSTKEDRYITDIISHTQEHDLSSRKILKAIEKVADQESKSA